MENKTPEEILNEFETKSTFILSQTFIEQMIIPAMEEYGKQQYNQAIKDFFEKLVICSKFSSFDKKLDCWSNKDELLKKLLKQ